jgi:hypothetical protein
MSNVTTIEQVERLLASSRRVSIPSDQLVVRTEWVYDTASVPAADFARAFAGASESAQISSLRALADAYFDGVAHMDEQWPDDMPDAVRKQRRRARRVARHAMALAAQLAEPIEDWTVEA